jgi:hypothetical protein
MDVRKRRLNEKGGAGWWSMEAEAGGKQKPVETG